jgi:hypothetical protein
MNVTKIMQHLIGKTYKEVVENLRYEEDYGDCCGWSTCSVEDSLESLSDKENAVLIDVVEIIYDGDDFERCVVNFIFDLGSNKGLILGYDMSAGSGSGWAYGAYVSLSYGEEEVASAQW